MKTRTLTWPKISIKVCMIWAVKMTVKYNVPSLTRVRKIIGLPVPDHHITPCFAA